MFSDCVRSIYPTDFMSNLYICLNTVLILGVFVFCFIVTPESTCWGMGRVPPTLFYSHSCTYTYIYIYIYVYIWREREREIEGDSWELVGQKLCMRVGLGGDNKLVKKNNKHFLQTFTCLCAPFV